MLEVTTIEFGGGVSVETSQPIGRVRELLEGALAEDKLVEVRGEGGVQIVINPAQVKFLLAGPKTYKRTPLPKSDPSWFRQKRSSPY